jgi:hypothetical protein
MERAFRALKKKGVEYNHIQEIANPVREGHKPFLGDHLRRFARSGSVAIGPPYYIALTLSRDQADILYATASKSFRPWL